MEKLKKLENLENDSHLLMSYDFVDEKLNVFTVVKKTDAIKIDNKIVSVFCFTNKNKIIDIDKDEINELFINEEVKKIAENKINVILKLIFKLFKKYDFYIDLKNKKINAVLEVSRDKYVIILTTSINKLDLSTFFIKLIFNLK